MKKIFYFVMVLSLGMMFYSCDEDFLDRTPMDQISDPEFWNSQTDMELYLNGFYDNIHGWFVAGGGWAPTYDYGTDMALVTPNRSTHNLERLDGAITVPSSGGGWNWGNVRDINYFLVNADRIEEEGPMVDHYIGEGHFFRAWFYFELLRDFGDLPIITEPVDADDEDVLYGTRRPRTEVADFILSDLDTAITKMKYGNELTDHQTRLSKDIALLFKARVALYEGTWEKYHEGTDFGGDTDGTEYLRDAAAAAKQVIDDGNYSLVQGDTSRVYYELFNQMDYAGNPEVLFFKHYDRDIGDNFSNQLWNWPNGYGWTREILQQFLCDDGLPISVSPRFEGDTLLENLPVNRDPRLVQSVMVPGDPQLIFSDGDTVIFEKPYLYESTTGYESKKFRLIEVDPSIGTENQNVDYIFFRFAEALLIYAEAKAELGTLTQGDVDMTINRLRDRVGMPHLVLADIEPDPNWPDYGYSLPDYLYEIRRERAVELLGEGFRFDDLMRWRAHNLFVGKRFTGTYYTDELREAESGLDTNEDGFLDPYVDRLSGPNGGYGFDVDRDYLRPIPTNELTLNDNLEQNPGWE